MTPQLRRRWLAAGLAIGALGLIIRIWLFQQPVNSDDVHYFGEASTAQSLSELGDASNSNGMRLAVMAIPAIYSHLVDSPRVAFYGTIYTVALLSFVGIYWFAWVLSGPRAAAFAAALWATSYTAIAVDTRLLPDNLGTAFALIGLALVALAGLRRDADPPPSTRKLIALAMGGGFLLWLSFCARESFFVFGGVGVGFGLLSRRRWLVTAAVLGGLLVGFLLEYACMSAAFGDGMLRWKVAFAYRKEVAEIGSSVGADAVPGGFGGYTLGDLFVRYPKLVLKASRTDFTIFLLGLAGFVTWGLRFRDRRALAKLGAGLAAYGFIAFGIVSVSPIVPLMREKLRYYACCAPFFCVATAELIAIALFSKVRHERIARWLNRPHRTIGVGILAGLVALLSLRIAARGKEFARNGNDAHWTASARILDDAGARDRVHTLYTDFRTSRVTYILMPKQWSGYQIDLIEGDRPPEPSGPGYVLLDWRRLNANTKSGFVSRDVTHKHYRYLDTNALVMRHRRGVELLDVFYMDDEPVTRTRTELDLPYPAAWTGVCGSSKDSFPLTDPKDCTKDLFRFSGPDVPWRSPGGQWLDGDQFVEVVLTAHAPEQMPLRGHLHWWPSHEAKAVGQLMSSMQVGPEPVTYTIWTYLPQEAEAFRVVLRGSSKIVVEDVHTYLLSREELDDVRAGGDAWSLKRVPDRLLSPIIPVLQADAKTHDRPHVVYSDPLTVRAGRALLADWDWREVSLGDAREHGYVIVDALRSSSIAGGLADDAVILRSNDGKTVIDVLFHGDAQPRARTPLVASFPIGWTRLLDSSRVTTALDGVDVSFTSDDPGDEYIYSGADFVWKPDYTRPISGDHLVEVTGTLSGEQGRQLRAQLDWWDAAGERHTQSLGSFEVGASPTRFAGWTYVPADATGSRVTFRGRTGVTIRDVAAHVLDRRDDDALQVIGKPW